MCLKQISLIARRLTTLVLLFALATSMSLADDSDAFKILNARFDQENSQLLLYSEVNIELPDYISEAIEQGFAVPISFEVELLETVNYWFDDKKVTLKQQYLLNFQPVLNAFVVSNVTSGQRRYFDSLKQAVRSLQVIRGYRMFDKSNIDESLDLYVRMRFGLDIEELPLPLKSSSLWDNDWDLQSDWFVWSVNQVDE